MFQRVELHGLCATKRRAFGNHTFPRNITRRTVTASMVTLSTVFEIEYRIDDNAITNHLSLSAQASVILANQALSAWSARLAMKWRVELYCLGATISQTRTDHAFTRYTRRTVTASVIAFATVIEIVCYIMADTIAVGVSETPAVNTIKTISTDVVASTTIIDVCLDIGQDTIADLHATSAIDAIDSFRTNGSVRTAMFRCVFFTRTAIRVIACVASKSTDTICTSICGICDIALRAMCTAVRRAVGLTCPVICVIAYVTSSGLTRTI